MKVKRTQNIDLKKSIAQANTTNTKVGFFSSATYENGDKVAEVAAQNEFGNMGKNIPPRPFMRPARDNNQWGQVFADASKNAIRKGQSIKTAFKVIGLQAEGDIKKAISEVTRPALKQATVEARLRGKKQGKSVSLTIAKPLVHTGYMLASVTHEVS